MCFMNWQNCACWFILDCGLVWVLSPSLFVDLCAKIAMAYYVDCIFFFFSECLGVFCFLFTSSVNIVFVISCDLILMLSFAKLFLFMLLFQDVCLHKKEEEEIRNSLCFSHLKFNWLKTHLTCIFDLIYSIFVVVCLGRA